MPAVDLYLDWGSDLVLRPAGDFQLAGGWDLVRQRCVRRILTNPATVDDQRTPIAPDYVFDPAYGHGVRLKIGVAMLGQDLYDLQQAIAEGCLLEPGVARDPAPQVATRAGADHATFVFINVTLATGEDGTIAVKLTS